MLTQQAETLSECVIMLLLLHWPAQSHPHRTGPGVSPPQRTQCPLFAVCGAQGLKTDVSAALGGSCGYCDVTMKRKRKHCHCRKRKTQSIKSTFWNESFFKQTLRGEQNYTVRLTLLGNTKVSSHRLGKLVVGIGKSLSCEKEPDSPLRTILFASLTLNVFPSKCKWLFVFVSAPRWPGDSSRA